MRFNVFARADQSLIMQSTESSPQFISFLPTDRTDERGPVLVFGLAHRVNVRIAITRGSTELR